MKIEIIEETDNEYNELCRKYNISIKEVLLSTLNKLLHEREESNKKWINEIEQYKNSEQYKNYLKIEINEPKVKIKNHNLIKGKIDKKEELEKLDYQII